MNMFTENVEKCACRICFTIENVEDAFQCVYNDEAMVDIVNILLKIPQAASNYLDKLCMDCLKAIINVHLFVRKLNDRKTFWEKARSTSRRKLLQTIALPTDSDDANILYDQKLLRIDEVRVKIEETNDCRKADSEHVDYELIIKDESYGIIDSDDCDVHHDNDECSNFDDEDNLRLRNLATTVNRVDSGVNRVLKYQDDFSIEEGEIESITKKAKCDAEKEARTHAHAKYAEKSVLCKECGKMYSINTIKRHMKLHKNPKPFQCDICEYVGIELSAHRKRYHDNLTEPLACQECDSFHYNLHDFKEHLKVHGQKYRVRTLNNSATNTCHICGKTYFFADTLAKHMLTHDENSDTWCKHCQKGFPSNFDYKRHIRVHTGEKPYACPYCPKSYTQKWLLRAHVTSHVNTSLDATSNWARSPKPLKTYTRKKVSLIKAEVSDKDISDALKDEKNS